MLKKLKELQKNRQKPMINILTKKRKQEEKKKRKREMLTIKKLKNNNNRRRRLEKLLKIKEIRKQHNKIKGDSEPNSQSKRKWSSNKNKPSKIASKKRNRQLKTKKMQRKPPSRLNRKLRRQQKKK